MDPASQLLQQAVTQLHRQDVLDGALAMLDAVGLDQLTTRKLAAHLGVQAGALYWHFANKQALLDAMADRLYEGGLSPERPAWATFAVGNYVLGHTIEEQGHTELVASGAWTVRRTELDERDPEHAVVLGAGFEADQSERFEYGLGLLLDGIRHQLLQQTITTKRRLGRARPQ